MGELLLKNSTSGPGTGPEGVSSLKGTAVAD